MNKDGIIVLDLETKRSFEEVGGRNFSELGVSVCVLYLYSEDRYLHFLESELGRMENYLLNAKLVVGFNHRKFDFPVLQPYFSVDVSKLPAFDIMEDLSFKLGHRIGLDSVAQATLEVGKTAKGLDAIRYYREQRWDELKKYCENDVKITKDVFDYGLEKGEIFYLSRDGSKKLRTSVDWEDKIPYKNKPSLPAQFKLL